MCLVFLAQQNDIKWWWNANCSNIFGAWVAASKAPCFRSWSARPWNPAAAPAGCGPTGFDWSFDRMPDPLVRRWLVCVYKHIYIYMKIYVHAWVKIEKYMCVCVQIYIYVCMYVCMHVCLYVCMSVCLYVCVYVCIYVCMHACMHLCMYVCMYACLHVCMYACMYVCMYPPTPPAQGGARKGKGISDTAGYCASYYYYYYSYTPTPTPTTTITTTTTPTTTITTTCTCCGCVSKKVCDCWFLVWRQVGRKRWKKSGK